MMRDFMALGDHCLYRVGIGLNRVAGHIPRAADAVFREQLEKPRRADAWAEFTARNPGRGGLPACDEARDSVEVEGETDDVLVHFMSRSSCAAPDGALCAVFEHDARVQQFFPNAIGFGEVLRLASLST